jgi:hypothetical protein
MVALIPNGMMRKARALQRIKDLSSGEEKTRVIVTVPQSKYSLLRAAK